MFYLLFSLLLAGTDLGFKAWAHKQPKGKLPKQVAGGYVELRNETNAGFAYNRFDNEPDVVKKLSNIAFVILALFCIPFMFSKRLTVVEKLGLSFLFGGALSNVAERNVRGYVVDYIHVKVDKFYKPNNRLNKDADATYRQHTLNSKLNHTTFNLADAFIVMGGVVVGASAILRDAHRMHQEDVLEIENED